MKTIYLAYAIFASLAIAMLVSDISPLLVTFSIFLVLFTTIASLDQFFIGKIR